MPTSSRGVGAARPEGEGEDDRHYGIPRVLAFSDGVFAFAITLLTISLLPYADFGSSPSAAQLLQRFLSAPFLFHLFSYVLGFYVIGATWQAHHWLFRHIIKLDAGLYWLNLTLLLCVAFLPFPTDLVGRYGNIAIVAAFYGGMLALLRLLQVVVWWYASSHHRLIRPMLDAQMIRYIGMRVLLPLPIYLLSIGVAFISPYLAQALWIATLFVPAVVTRIYKNVDDW